MEKCEKAFCESLIDYFTVVLKKHTLNDIISYFGKDYYKADFAPLHYEYMLVYYEKIKVLVSSRQDMNICILLSGRGCRELETHYSWDTFFRFIKQYDYKKVLGDTEEYMRYFNVTRIDYSYDFYNWNFDILSRVKNHFDKNLFTTRMRKNILTIEKSSNGELSGRSIRFGKRGNDFTIIFYDKMLERKNSDHIISDKIKRWYRMESTFANELSNILFDIIVANDNITEFVSQYIYKRLDFKIHVKGYSGRNLYKVKTALWWNKMLNTLKKSTFSKKAYQCTIDQKKNYIEHSVAKTLSLVYVMQNLVNGDTTQQTYLKSLWEIGSEKVSDKELGIANDFLEKNGKEKININELKQLIDNLE
ncbi:MAG: replication initiation factor domain-containing protein [Bacilli bacterium]